VKQVLGWAFVLIAAYLCALIVLMPARYALNNVAPKLGIELDRSLSFESISGRLWDGQMEGLQYQDKMVGEVSWQLNFSQLLIGDMALHWTLRRQNGEFQGDVVFNPSGAITLLNTQGELPANELLQLSPYAIVPVSGTISADIPEILIETDRVKTIDGQLVWKQAEIDYGETIALGDITIELNTAIDDGLIAADITNQQGVISIKSSATLNNSGQYQLKGVLTPVDARARNMIKMASMFGRLDRSGKLRFNRSGSLY